MSNFPAFEARTSPRWRGRIIDREDDWPSGEIPPRLIGEPELDLARSSLYVQPFGTSGAYGSYFRFFWIDRVADPSTGALSVSDYLLYGEHRLDSHWDGSSPFAVGFGVAVEIRTGIAFAAAGADSYEWTFFGERRLPRESISIDFRDALGSNPLLFVQSAGRKVADYSLADGSDRATIGQTKLVLGFEDTVAAAVRGNMTLGSALRRPLVLLPEFDSTTLLSLPLTAGIEPDIGPPANDRETYGDLLFVPFEFGNRLQKSALEIAPRRDFSGDLPGSVFEGEIENEFDPSDAHGSDHDWGTLPTGNGNSTTIITGSSYGNPPFDFFGGVLQWRKGSTATKLTRTFTGISAANEVWVFSAWVRNSGIVADVTPEISGTEVSVQGATRSGDWVRIYAAGRQSGADVTVSIDLEVEGQMVDVCGCQLEKIGDYGEGFPSSLVPHFGITNGRRKKSTLVFPKNWPCDAGTWIAVFRMRKRGGGADNSLVPVLAAYDTGTTSYKFEMVLGAGTGGSGTQKLGYVNSAGAFVGATNLTIANEAVVHLAVVLEPKDAGGDAKVTATVYHNGASIASSDDTTLRGTEILGDEIHVAPASGLPSYSSVEMSPFAGPIELVRLDGRAWTAAEVAEHAELWTTDAGRDLVTLSQGRRFDLRAGYANIPGAAKYALSAVRWIQRDAVPRAVAPFRAFLT